jgi:precorrin-6B methylase 2
MTSSLSIQISKNHNSIQAYSIDRKSEFLAIFKE